MRGKDVTPFVLDHLHRASEGATLAVNVRLVAAQRRAGRPDRRGAGGGSALSDDGRVVVVGDVATDVVVVLAGEPAPGSDRPGLDQHPRRRRGRQRGRAPRAAGHARRAGRAASATTRPGGARRRTDGGGGAAGAADGPRRARPATIVSLVEPDGQRSILADRGRTWSWRPATCRPRGPAATCTSPGYTLLDPRPRAAGLQALRDAAAAGCTVSVDPASTGPLARYGVDRWLADTAAATLLLPNAEEARLLTGCRDAEDAARALAARYPVVAVKLGPDGALWASGDVLVHRPAQPPPSSTPPAPVTRSPPACSRSGWPTRTSIPPRPSTPGWRWPPTSSGIPGPADDQPSMTRAGFGASSSRSAGGGV